MKEQPSRDHTGAARAAPVSLEEGQLPHGPRSGIESDGLSIFSALGRVTGEDRGILHKNLALTVGDSERSFQFLTKLIRLSN